MRLTGAAARNAAGWAEDPMVVVPAISTLAPMIHPLKLMHRTVATDRPERRSYLREVKMIAEDQGRGTSRDIRRGCRTVPASAPARWPRPM